MYRERAVQAYRLYLFDNAGHIRGPAVEITAADDEAAIEAAPNHGEGAMELWQRERLVERFEARRQEA
jgi:hypothetical protein